MLDVFPFEIFIYGNNHGATYPYYIEELVKGQETNISYIMSDGNGHLLFLNHVMNLQINNFLM